MKVFDSSCCDTGGGGSFDPDDILTTSIAGSEYDQFEVLIGWDGNVLVREF